MTVKQILLDTGDLQYLVSPSTPRLHKTILCFHGGCFVGGNVYYDKDQNEKLSLKGFSVYQLNFPKNI